jgi:two-component system chemotaxis response regulator CheB
MNKMQNKIKVFIIDDSVMVRTLFSKAINAIEEMEVVGFATDPIMAEKRLKNMEVDVILLDIEMPKMNGLEYLEQIMKTNPLPIIICSTKVENKKSPEALKALALGAVDIIGKDDTKIKEFLNNSSNKLISSIKKATNHKFTKKTSHIETSNISHHGYNTSTMIAIGASTGGIAIIENILSQLPKQTPPILIVQHMPAGFIESMANRINDICKIKVKQAIHNELIEDNTAYISPGDIHMSIKRIDGIFRINLQDGIKINQHKPSIDILFKSFSKELLGHNIKAFILTGMGNDGALGIKSIKDKGGKTYAQDEKSCTVYGMPKEAIKLDAITQSLTPKEIINYIIN